MNHKIVSLGETLKFNTRLDTRPNCFRHMNRLIMLGDFSESGKTILLDSPIIVAPSLERGFQVHVKVRQFKNELQGSIISIRSLPLYFDLRFKLLSDLLSQDSISIEDLWLPPDLAESKNGNPYQMKLKIDTYKELALFIPVEKMSPELKSVYSQGVKLLVHVIDCP